MEVERTKRPTLVRRWASGRSLPSASRSSVIVLNLTTLKILAFLPGRSWKKKAPAPLLAKWSQVVTAAKGMDKTRRAEPEAAMSMARLKKSRYGFICLVYCGGSRKVRRGGGSAVLSIGYAVFSIGAVRSMVVLGGDARCLRV